MPGQFPTEQTESEVVLVYQLVDAIFDISKSDEPRKRVWKYHHHFPNGAKRVRNRIWKIYKSPDAINDVHINEIFQTIALNLKPSYMKTFESGDQNIIKLKEEFIKRLQVLHFTRKNRQEQQ
jgi:hypothetical protein